MAPSVNETPVVYSPHTERHYMWLQPARRRLRAFHGERLLAETERAVRVVEVGHGLLDPVVYFPPEALVAPLPPAAHDTTWCPLKGRAVYYDLVDEAGSVAVPAAAWSYTDPILAAQALTGLVAFDPKAVTIVDAPL